MTKKLYLPIIAILVILLPALFQLFYIFHFGVNVPIWDDWDQIQYIKASYDETLDPVRLIAQHGEHRIFFPRLIILLLAKLTQYNIVAQLATSWMLRVLTIWVMFILYKKFAGYSLSSIVGFAPVSLLFFSIHQYESLLKGDILAIHLYVLFAVLTFYALENSQKNPYAFLSGLICAIGASFSIMAGLVVWVVGFVQLWFLNPVRKKIFLTVWSALGSATWYLYFYGWIRPIEHPAWSYVLLHPRNTLSYFLTMFGGAIEPSSIHRAMFLGTFITLIAMYCVLFAYRARPRYLVATPVAIMGYLVIALVLASLTRGAFGNAHALYTTHYVTVSISAVIGIYLMLSFLRGQYQKSRIFTAIHIVLFCVMTFGFFYGIPNGIMGGKIMQDEARELADTLKKFPSIPQEELARTCPFVGCSMDTVRFLYDNRLSVFR